MFNLLYWLKHHNDTREEKEFSLLKAKQEMILVARQTQESLSNEPATKEVHGVYESLDKMCKSLEDE